MSDWSSDVCSSDLAGRWLRWCRGCSPWLHRDGEAAPAELRKQAVVAGEVDRADRDEAVAFAQQALQHRQPARVARFDQAMPRTLPDRDRGSFQARHPLARVGPGRQVTPPGLAMGSENVLNINHN